VLLNLGKKNQQDTAGQVTRQDQEGPSRARLHQAGPGNRTRNRNRKKKQEQDQPTGATNRNTGNFDRKTSVFEKHLQSEQIVFVIL
jgi:hypothetical protein